MNNLNPISNNFMKYFGYLKSNLGVVKYLDKKYLGGDLGGGGAALDQSTMVLSAKQLVLIFFIGMFKIFFFIL